MDLSAQNFAFLYENFPTAKNLRCPRYTSATTPLHV